MAIRVDEKCKRCADRVIWYCLAGNLFLCIFKAVIGSLCGSMAVLADALHSGADVLDSTITLIMIHLGKKPADKTHPYGHGKAEFIGGVFIGVALLSGASWIVVSSIGELMRKASHAPPHFLALGAAVISIVINEFMFRQAMCAARRTNSAAIEAEAWDNRSDALSSVPVFFGVLGAQFGFRSLDPLAALLVGILVGKIGFELLGKNIHGLMDIPLDSREVRRIKMLVTGVPGVKAIDYLRTRGMGRYYIADIQILVNPKVSVAKSNAIAAEIRGVLQREIKHLEDITIACKAHSEKQDSSNTLYGN